MVDRFMHLESFFHDLADAAQMAIMPYFRGAAFVSNKIVLDFDPVTIADRAAEKAMRALITARFPNHGIVGEEFGVRRSAASNVWILDPIDGTRAFICGLPTWGTLIGFSEESRPRVGMMAQPFIGERFFGCDGKAWHIRRKETRKRLSVRPCADLTDAILLTTSPQLFDESDLHAYAAVETRARMARYGTDCYGYVMVAAGQADAVVEAGLSAYDIAPLIPIVEGAGGCVTDWHGNPAPAGGRVLATGDPRLHAMILTLLQEHMTDQPPL